MPQLERAAFEGSDLQRTTSDVTPLYAGREELMVFKTDASYFRRFAESTYKSHAYKWESVHPNSSFDTRITLEEWTKYAFTALRARIARVNDESGVRVPRSDQEWQIPSMIATVLNGIGRVTVDVPALTIVPVWNPEYDVELLTIPEWQMITAKLRAIAADREYTKFIFVRSLTGDRNGDKTVMDLIPVRDELGRVRQLRGTHPFDGVSAFIYLACGFMPDLYEGVPLPTLERLVPRYMPEPAIELGIDELGFRSA